jgi:predicted MFS family arabinose efflux permease
MVILDSRDYFLLKFNQKIGLGAFAFAPFTQFLVEQFGWKMTMIILSALTLHCCIFGALLKPLDKKKLNKNKAR